MISINKNILHLMNLFNESFINKNKELILYPKYNIYFSLEGVKTVADLKCKVLAYLSRPSCKGIPEKEQKYCRDRFNEFFGTSFNKDEMTEIYTYLGNDCNREKSKRFIKSGYNVKILNHKER